MRLSSGASGCSGPVDAAREGFGLVEGLLEKLEASGVDTSRLKGGVKEDQLRIESMKLAPIVPVSMFAGNPDAGMLYRYGDDNRYVLSGRCPFCTALAMWPQFLVVDGDDGPTVVKANGEVATVHCGCSACSHKWRVVEGKVERA